ncbi:MAG TPA: hypothetical protein VFE61_13580 [Candidatus Sulfotelmatobacter sp.]|jgi:hypothetical protein|nr:hypothetical protein [Candidatus Sulfotelmatobacter sp.]
MKSIVRRGVAIVTCLLVTLPAFAGTIPVRGTSNNGENGGAQSWAMMGPTQLLTLVKGTSKVMYKQQIVCASQDLANVSDASNKQDAGTCESGNYLYIFQLRSTATNVNVLLSGLMGFTPDANSPNYGVMLCDATNTLEMCTTATQDQLPNITFSTNASHTIATFSIPNFPNFPTGTNHQGQGLTIFVLCSLGQPRPVALPRIVLN